MVTLILYSPNLVVIDKEHIVDIEKLNKLIKTELIIRGDLPSTDSTTNRAIRENEYIVVHAHGSFDGSEMINWLKSLLLKNNVRVNERDVTEQEKKQLSHLMPKFSIMNRQYQGAPIGVSDSRDTIDEHVKDICEAVNLIEGIETFASCDGHYGARPFYFCYTAKTLRDAERALYYLRACVNKYFTKLNVNLNNVNVELNTEYMPDGIPTGIYFKFMIAYHNSESEKIYQFERLAAKEIKHQLKIGNTGVKNGQYYFYDEIN